MDTPKNQPTAATTSRPAAAKKPTTLLDAYEVECIRRELERFILKQNTGVAAAACSDAVAETHDHGHHHHHRSSSKKTSANNANPAPAKKGSSGRGVRLLGRHAVAMCGPAVPVASAGHTGRRRRCGGYQEVEKV